MRDVVRAIAGWFGCERHVTPSAVSPAIEAADDVDVLGEVARLLWTRREETRIVVAAPHSAYDNDQGAMSACPGMRRHQMTLPGGVTVSLASENEGNAHLTTPSGDEREASHYGKGAERIDAAWRAVQALAIAEDLGLDTGEVDGAEPASLVAPVTAEIARLFEAGVPVGSDERYMGVDYSRRAKDGRAEYSSDWMEIGPIRVQRLRFSSMGLVLHPVVGSLVIDWKPIADAIDRRRRNSMIEALGVASAAPPHLPMPRGNARATRTLRLCREAVAADPELTDARGTPIAPLVERHLPELMRRHAEAARNAPVQELQSIDDELAAGIETVRRAVDEALTLARDHDRSDSRDRLREQLAFLEMRHPSDELTPSIPSTTKDAA